MMTEFSKKKSDITKFLNLSYLVKKQNSPPPHSQFSLFFFPYPLLLMISKLLNLLKLDLEKFVVQKSCIGWLRLIIQFSLVSFRISKNLGNFILPINSLFYESQSNAHLHRLLFLFVFLINTLSYESNYLVTNIL